jgi:gliding motility-associated transport system permease protein
MKGTVVIFRRELGAYLGSPVGYLVTAAVLLLDGLLFYAQALGPTAGERLSGEVLAAFFYSASGLTIVAAVVLSIRLIAEERQTGTQVLLNTSPLRDWEIVLGKFLSALAFLTGITLVTLYMPLLILVNGKVSVTQILVGYLGLVLLGAAVLAIGVFATALTRHPLVAAVTGAVITGTMLLFWPLAQVVGPPTSLVFAALALHGRHFAGFQAGLLHTRDVFYYLAVTYFFLLAAVKVMEAKRWE